MAKPTCGVIEDGEVCGEPINCRDMCARHYTRWRIHGEPTMVLAHHRRARSRPADIETESKVCSTCKRRLPLTEFHRRSGAPDGLMYRCKDCRNDAYNKRYANDPEFRERRRRHNRTQYKRDAVTKTRRRSRGLAMYGLTEEDFNTLAAAQGGVCAICKQPPYGGRKDGFKTRLSVDHDHATRKIRGLLCDPCNIGLGVFKDSPELLAVAIAYLERNRGESAKELPDAATLW